MPHYVQRVKHGWLEACVPLVCEPSANVCQGGALYQCNEMGTALRETAVDSCRGRVCIEGECRPIKHNVAILFDTSESMNSCAVDSNSSYEPLRWRLQYIRKDL